MEDPSQGSYLTCDVTPRHPGGPSQREESQVCISPLPETRSTQPSLDSPSPHHGASATAFAMHPSGLSLALTLDFPSSTHRGLGSHPCFWFSVFLLVTELVAVEMRWLSLPILLACPPQILDALGITLPCSSSMSSLL